MWDYLRRSGQGGYFLPLSGGIDSSSSACIVASMCHLVCKAVSAGGVAVMLVNSVSSVTLIGQYSLQQHISDCATINYSPNQSEILLSSGKCQLFVSSTSFI